MSDILNYSRRYMHPTKVTQFTESLIDYTNQIKGYDKEKLKRIKKIDFSHNCLYVCDELNNLLNYIHNNKKELFPNLEYIDLSHNNINYNYIFDQLDNLSYDEITINLKNNGVYLSPNDFENNKFILIKRGVLCEECGYTTDKENICIDCKRARCLDCCTSYEFGDKNKTITICEDCYTK